MSRSRIRPTPRTAGASAWGSLLVRRIYERTGYADDGERAAFSHVMPRVVGGRLLDIGVGAGRTSSILAPPAANYVGVDVSDGMIRLARQRYPDLDLRVMDARKLGGIDDESLDVVVFSYNGIDLVEREGRHMILREVCRALEPGGLFVFSTLNLDGMSFGETPASRRDMGSWSPRPASGLGRVLSPRRVVSAGLRLARKPISYRNFAANALQARWNKDWAVWPLRAHEFRFLAHFTTLGRMRRDLEDAGFAVRAVWDQAGSVVDVLAETCAADYMHFVAEKRP